MRSLENKFRGARVGWILKFLEDGKIDFEAKIANLVK